MAKIVIYDPTDINVPNRVIQYSQSANTPDYSGNINTLVNPTIDVLLDSVPSRYWKYSDSNLVEMSTIEKALIDDSLSLVSYKFSEKTNIESTTSTDYIYLTLDLNIIETGIYKVSYTVNLKYQNQAWQYYKYKVDIDGNIEITNPGYNSGWVQPTLFDSTNNNFRGLSFSGYRPIVLSAGLHTINLRIGSTSTLSVNGLYGLLEVESK